MSATSYDIAVTVPPPGLCPCHPPPVFTVLYVGPTGPASPPDSDPCPPTDPRPQRLPDVTEHPAIPPGTVLPVREAPEPEAAS